MRVMKRLSALFFLGLLLFSFTSCGTVKQLRDKSLVQGVGIDKTKGGFEVTFQVLDISKSSGTGKDVKGNITTTYSAKGNTISTAIANGQKVLDRETFMAQNKLLVVSEKVVKEGLEQVLDYFIRAKSCRPDVQMAVTKESAKKIIEAQCKDAIIPAEKIQKTIINGEYNAKSVNLMVMDVVNAYKNPVSGIYLPVLKLFTDDEKENVTLDGVAVLSKKGLQGYLNDEQTRGLLWATNQLHNSILVIKTKKLGEVSLRVRRSHTKTSIAAKDNRIHFTISVDCRANVNEISEGMNLTLSQADLAEVQKEAEQLIKREVTETSEKCLGQFHADTLSIGRKLSQKDYKFYKKIKNNFEDELPFVQITINAKVTIQRMNNVAVKS